MCFKKIEECKGFAINGDETRDFTNSEQLSILVWWVSSNYEIHEDPIGMIQVPKTDFGDIINGNKRCFN